MFCSPERFERKQTLANAERFATKELTELQDPILSAEDRLSKLEYEVFKGESGSSVAPLVDSEYVKIAEVFVPANSIEIDDEYIINVTNDVAGEDNPGWTSEKDSTYNIGYITDVNDRFRQQHKADGSHKNDIIGTDELKIGTASKDSLKFNLKGIVEWLHF